MKKTMLLITAAILLAFLPAQAQEDSLQTNRYVMRSTLYGIGFTNLLDTYLSPMEYTGPELRILRENMRMTNLLDGKVSRQSLFQANVAMTENKAGTGSEMHFMANWNLAWHYQFHINEHLKLLAGPNIEINGGALYNLRNSNNPVQVKAYANIGASGAAIWRFKIKNYPLTVRYQLNIPLAGLMFSPEYGEGYYEISESGDWGKNLYFTSLHNQPSLRQFLTLDFPVMSATVRVGYVNDVQQAKLNDLKSHAWSHTFMVGFVKNFYLLKGKSANIAIPY